MIHLLPAADRSLSVGPRRGRDRGSVAFSFRLRFAVDASAFRAPLAGGRSSQLLKSIFIQMKTAAGVSGNCQKLTTTPAWDPFKESLGHPALVLHVGWLQLWEIKWAS